MIEFVLEDEIHNVKNKKTKEYLREVISTYQHGDYRSCIVTLYVITIYDLLERIRILSEVYDNQLAKGFLHKYREKTSPGKNTKYSDLEHEIMEQAKVLNILSDIEFRQVEELRALRHDCAHPAISYDTVSTSTLYQPNKDEVRAKIRIMFEILFLKDPSVMEYVLKMFEEDLKQYYKAYSTQGLKDYLNQKYFSRMNLNHKKKILYSPLWYRIFLSQNSDDIMTVDAYCKAMGCLIDSDKEELLTYICETPDKFSGNTLENNLIQASNGDWLKEGKNNKLYLLITLLFKHPKIYKGLNPQIQQILKLNVFKDFNLMWCSHFLFNSLQEHVDSLINFMDENEVCNTLQEPAIISEMYKFAAERGTESLYNKVVKIYFFNKQEGIYTCINNAYHSVLSVAIPYMNESEIMDIFESSEKDPSIMAAWVYKDYLIPQIMKIAEERKYQKIIDYLKG